MPGSVSSASPTTVMPWSLAKAFSHSREFALIENEYKDGASQRSLQVATSRKSWRLSKRLAPADLEELRDFYDARHGSQQPFYTYDVTETSPKYSYDETGVATTGRYTVRFEGPWQQSMGIARGEVEIAYAEIV